MASKYGYMATIGADTSGLTAALKNIENDTKNISRELKQVNEGLKFDPSSIENMAAKSELLSKAIEKTKEKLEALKSAEAAINEAAAKGTITTEQQRQYQRELSNTESQLRQYQQQLSNTEAQLKKAEAATDDVGEETKQLGKTIDDAGKKSIKFGDILKANVLSDFVVSGIRKLTSEFVDFAKESIEVASNLTEVQNVVDVTFGDDAGKIYTWAENAKNAYGMSQLAAEKYAGTMGAMLKSSGIAGDEVQKLSTDLVGLAGDMASFYNLDIETAFTKIRSGISGETEPLKQLGINMSVANMEAFALAQGIEKSWRSMSQAEQTQLRYLYLMEQTADAQGDFVRTSDSFANQQRIMQLNMEEMKANLGEKLVPIVNNLMGMLNNGLPTIGVLIDTIGNNISELTNIIGNSGEIISEYFSLIGDASAADRVKELSDELERVFGQLGDFAAEGAADLVEGLLSVLPATANVAEKLIAQFASSIGNKAPELVPAAVKCVVELANGILDNANLIISAAGDLISGLQKGIIDSVPILIEAAPGIIVELAGALISAATTMFIDVPAKLCQFISDGLIEHDWSETASVSMKNLKNAYEKAVDDTTELFTSMGDNLYELMTLQFAEGSVDLSDLSEFRGKSKEELAALVGETESQIDSYKAALQELVDVGGYADLLSDGTRTKLTEWFGDANMYEAETLLRDHISLLVEDKQRILAAYQEITDAEAAGLQGMAEANNNQRSYIAEEERKKGLARAEAQKQANEEYAKQQEEFENQLKADWENLATEYNKHLIVDANGEQDEEAYYKKRRQYLEEHCDKSSEVWWKYWDEVTAYEKKKRDEKANQDKEDSDKAKKDAEDKAKAEFDAWKDAASDAYDETTKEYQALVSEKEKAFNELSSIDLTATVKDKDGNEKTILTDLNKARQQLTEYETALEKLKATGISDDLMNEILGMNYENGDRMDFIQTLLSLDKSKLDLYYSDYAKYNAKAMELSQEQIQDKLTDLNAKTESAVDGIFKSMPESAYEEGAKTAQSFLQGIYDSMGDTVDLNAARAVLNLNGSNGGGSAAASSGKSETVAALNTPITIVLNDKEYINTTLGEVMSNSALTGSNQYSL